MSPETVRPRRRPPPVPSWPVNVIRPGRRVSCSPSCDERRSPDVEVRLTSSDGSAGSRTAMSPDTLSRDRRIGSRIHVKGHGARHGARLQVAGPAAHHGEVAEAVVKDRSPSSESVSTLPDTVSASTEPAMPSRVTAPDTLRADVAARIPVTVAAAETTPSSTSRSGGTAIDTVARRCSWRGESPRPHRRIRR